jgi:hypothetical protein
MEAPAHQASPTEKGREESLKIIYSQDGERTTLLTLAPKLPWSCARSVAPRNGETKGRHSLRESLIFKKKRCFLVFSILQAHPQRDQ